MIVREFPDNSVHLPIFSPPFSSLYIYSDDYADMGNTKNHDEFFAQFDFLIPELYRITVPGRVCCVHCKQLVRYKNRDGAAGLYDFRGDLIRAFEKHGWVYHSEVCIWTDPVLEMQKTKSQGLLYRQLRKDSSYSRQGLPDYLVVFRKHASDDADPEPVTKTTESFPLDDWQRYASPVWFDIRRTDVLQAYQKAKDGNDEKHICPLQLTVIKRAIRLWSNPDDVVFSPFMGIGSEGYVAVKQDRKFVGIELKASYYEQALSNIERAEREATRQLFAEVE